MPRPRTALALPATLLLATALLGGCGSKGSPSPGGSSATAPPSATPSASPSLSTPPTPAVLTRTGGLAGYDDRLEVAPDGSVTGTTRAAQVTCRVAADLAGTLTTAAPPSPAGPAAGTDRMTVTLTRAGTSIPLGEAQGGDPLSEAARTLLDDVQQPADARTVCR